MMQQDHSNIDRQTQDELAELRIKRAVSEAIAPILQWQAVASLQLAEIKQQTIKTNGRVTLLELWRERWAGAMAACGVIGGIVSTFLGKLIP